MLTYDTEKTPCYPCEWYGGPFWNGRRMDNSFVYYFRTEDEAIANAIRLMERPLLQGKAGTRC